MAQETGSHHQQSFAYNSFILVLTILLLAIQALVLLPLSASTIALLSVYANLICVIFPIDLFLNLRAAPKNPYYFTKESGWLDLLHSIPSFGITKYRGLQHLPPKRGIARQSFHTHCRKRDSCD